MKGKFCGNCYHFHPPFCKAKPPILMPNAVKGGILLKTMFPSPPDGPNDTCGEWKIGIDTSSKEPYKLDQGD